MKPFKDWPIGRKIYTMILLTAIASVTLTFLALILNDGRILKDQQRRRLISLGHVIGRNAQASVTFADATNAELLLAALDAEKSVRSAAIYLPGGPAFAVYRGGEAPPATLGDARRESAGAVTLPITLNGEDIAYIYLSGDRRQLMAVFYSNLIIVAWIALLALAFAAALSFKFQKTISVPIMNLTLFAREIAADKNYAAVPAKTSNDEIGVLSDSLTGMLAEIREREDQRRRHEETLQKTNQELAKTNKELEQFAYIASHDLQEPLRKIITFSERLTEHRDALPPSAKDYLMRMHNAGRRMKTVIEDLLQYSRISRGERSFERVNLREIFEEVTSDLELLMKETGARIETEDLPTLTGSKSQIRHLFQNLVSNSIKFAKKGVPPVIAVKGSRSESESIVRVTDNGIGFDEKYKEKIFQPFQRLHGKEEYEGTGIGLSIVQKIVNNHGGRIDVTSLPGQGTTFIVAFPLVEGVTP